MGKLLGVTNLLCGLYYKNITSANDTFRAVSEWHHNLEHHLQSSVKLLESSIMLQESSIMLQESSIKLLENIHSAGVSHDDHHMMIVMCL